MPTPTPDLLARLDALESADGDPLHLLDAAMALARDLASEVRRLSRPVPDVEGLVDDLDGLAYTHGEINESRRREGYAPTVAPARNKTRTKLTDALRSLSARAEAAERELERHRHGTTIEGDAVCPEALRAEAAEASRERLRSALATSLHLLAAVRDLATDTRTEETIHHATVEIDGRSHYLAIACAEAVDQFAALTPEKKP